MLALLAAVSLSAVTGAKVPFITYEAEDAVVAGGASVVKATNRKFGDLPSEASGRSCVQLGGGSVTFTSTADFNSIVIRASVAGTGTLAVAVDGAAVGNVPFDAKYRGNSGETNHLFDDGHLLFTQTYKAGAKVSVSGSGAVDLIDLELVAPPIAKPDGFEDITDYGAKEGSNASPAIKAAVAAAVEKKSKGIWLPVGTWLMDNIDGVTDTGKIQLPAAVNSHPTKFEIAGAGMWYSILAAVNPGNDDWGRNWGFDCQGQTAYYHDFQMQGQNRGRTEGGKPLVNGYGAKTEIANLWVEHSTIGFWVGGATVDFPAGLTAEQKQSNGLHIHDCRIRNTGADGINLCAGTTNALVENVHARGNGDDSFATWSEKDGWVNSDEISPGGCQELVFKDCTASCTWRANGIGVYGGKNHQFSNMLIKDVFVYHGLMIDTTTFQCSPATGYVKVDNCAFIRTSGEYWGQYWAGVGVYAGGEAEVTISNTKIIDSWYGCIRFRDSTPNCKFTDCVCDGFCQAAGDWAVGFIGPFGKGSVTFTNVVQCNWGGQGESFYGNPRHLDPAVYHIGAGCNFDENGPLSNVCGAYEI